MKAKPSAVSDVAAFVARKQAERHAAPCVVCASPDVDAVNEVLRQGAAKPYVRQWLGLKGIAVSEAQMKRHAGQHVQK